MKKIFLVLALMAVGFMSCNQPKKEKPAADTSAEVTKHDAIEVNLSTAHLDEKSDVLTVEYTVYSTGERHKVYVDTIPALGMTTDTSYVKNDAGDDVPQYNQVKKDYPFFVKLK